MKTVIKILIAAIAVMLVIFFVQLARAEECKFGRTIIQNCILGNVDIDGADDLARVQNARWIFGSVIVQGQMMLGDERLDVLDLGGVEWISGFVYIHGNTYLKRLYAPSLMHASFISVINNPMLNPCDAWDIGNQARCRGGVSCVESDMFDEWMNSGECPEDEKF